MRSRFVFHAAARLIAASLVALVAVVASGALPGASPGLTPGQRVKQPDVGYVPTPQSVVEAMLRLARVTSRDVVYDLGSGDGRIPITAARLYGARGVGIEIDPVRIRESEDNARRAGVADRVVFLQQDIFETDLREATVVTLFLLPWMNMKLMPTLQRDLRPGARIVAHHFLMGDAWPPDQSEDVNGLMIHLWTVLPRRTRP